jgi:uncharacterized protein
MGESMGAAILLQSVREETGFCAVVAESSFASFRQIAYVRVGQFVGTGTWLGRVALRPAVELAFLDGRITRGVSLTEASPENAVAGSHVPILLIHGLLDDNIPFQQSERIHARKPADITLWEVPGARHCGAVSVVHRSSTTACWAGFLPTITLSHREKLRFKRVPPHAPQANEK